jgi:hypothetical protein
MPLFFANHVAYLWDRHNPSVFTLCLCPGCCGGVANNEFSFPGVITLTTGVVSEDGKLFTVFKHPNMHIAPDIKEKHCAMLSELLWIDLNDPERKNLDWYDTIREHFKVYRDFVHGGMTSVYTEEGIENFLKYTVDVEKAEMVAQWRFDETLQRMNLVQFFLPAALKKLRDQRDAQKKQQENEQQYAAQVQKLKKRIGGGVLVGFAALAGVLLHYKEKIAARIVRKQIKKAAYF